MFSYFPLFSGWPVPVSRVKSAPKWLASVVRVFLWPLYRTKVDAVTSGRVTLFLCNPTMDLVAHEYCHRLQAQQYGVIRFAAMYALEYLRHGYWNNRFEVEAREYAAMRCHGN